MTKTFSLSGDGVLTIVTTTKQTEKNAAGDDVMVDNEMVRNIQSDQIAAHRRDTEFDAELRAGLDPADLAKLDQAAKG